MSCDPAAARRTPTFDPADLTVPQRDGDACVVCHKKWPRPRVRTGRLPDGSPVMACDDCAKALQAGAPSPRRDQRPRRATAP